VGSDTHLHPLQASSFEDCDTEAFFAEVTGVQPVRRLITDLAIFKMVYLCQLGTSKNIVGYHSPIMILLVAISSGWIRANIYPCLPDRIRTCIFISITILLVRSQCRYREKTKNSEFLYSEFSYIMQYKYNQLRISRLFELRDELIFVLTVFIFVYIIF